MFNEHLYWMPNSSRLHSYISPLSWAECPSYLLLNSAHVYILVFSACTVIPHSCPYSQLDCTIQGVATFLFSSPATQELRLTRGDTGVQQAPMNEWIHWYRALSSNLGPVGWLSLQDANAIPCLPRAIGTASPTIWPNVWSGVLLIWLGEPRNAHGKAVS